MDFIDFIKVVLLGLVEGLTEFAPVSSTGHMILVDDMWLKSADFLTVHVANTFKIVIQLGAIMAVVVMYWSRFMDLLGIRRMKEQQGAGEQGRLNLLQVIVGLIPAGLIGLMAEDYIDKHLFSVWSVLIGLVIGALMMIAADKFAPRHPRAQTIDQMTYGQALVVGLLQVISLWPGFSRSGSTISAGVLVGMSYRAAADFTFIMAVPIMAGASFLSLYKNWAYFTMDALPYFITGFVVAFIVSLFVVKFFLQLINRIKLLPFAVYRIVLAVVVWLIFF